MMKTKLARKSHAGMWNSVKLGDNCKVTAGGTPLTTRSDYWGGDVPWMNSGDLNKGVIFSVEGRITELGLNSSSAKIIPENSVLIGLAGQGKTRGTVAINKIPLATNQSVGAFIPDEQSIDYRFLFYNLRKRYVQLRQISAGDGGRGGLNLQILKSIKVNLPPLPEQKRIVGVLGIWDEYLEKLSRKIELKKQIKKGLMQRLLTGKKGLSGFKKKWRSVKLGDILKERNERDVESEALQLYSLTIENGVCPKSERYNRSFLVKSENKEYKKTYKNDIVYNPANLRYGAIAQNKSEYPVLLSPIYKVLFLRNSTADNIDYISHVLTWERQVRKMSSYAEGTLIERMEVKIDSFKLIQIDIPFKEEQDLIAGILTKADQEIKALENKKRTLEAQKKYLLDNLITGQIRTPENLTDGLKND